ncbi:hypothetical protein BDW67DRAFT_180100 [Aspergillus spinulosporus]
MDPDYVLDPRGEVILVVQKPNAPFAEWSRLLPPLTSPDAQEPLAKMGMSAMNGENTTGPAPTPEAGDGNDDDDDDDADAIIGYPNESAFVHDGEELEIGTSFDSADGSESASNAEFVDGISAEDFTEPGLGHDVEEDDSRTCILIPTQPGSPDHNKEADSHVQIQVSARHLALGSPVFDRMLHGNWKEGREFKEKGSIVLVVDSWDVDAFLVVLYILHSQLLKLPRKVTIEQLAKIAVIADYYDCQSVRFFGSLWVRCLPRKPPASPFHFRDIMLGLWISYFFRHALTFSAYSRAAIEQSDYFISSLGLPIPATIIDDLNDKRIDAIGRLIDGLYDRRDHLLSDDASIEPGCTLECRSIVLGTLMRHMNEHNFRFHPPEAPYVGIRLSNVRNVERFRAPDWAKRDERYPRDSEWAYVWHDCQELALARGFETWSSVGLDLADYTA